MHLKSSQSKFDDITTPTFEEICSITDSCVRRKGTYFTVTQIVCLNQNWIHLLNIKWAKLKAGLSLTEEECD